MNAALANLFYYQNPNNNKPSSSAVSAKQLCRIICPKATTNVSSSNSNDNDATKKGFITETTAVIPYDPVSGSFGEAGWKPASEFPILQEACSSWHYELLNKESKDGEDQNAGGDGDGDSSSKSKAAPTSTVKGPVNCRGLAFEYFDANRPVCNDTRVWSPKLNEWKKIIEIPSLLNAMEAFADDVKMDNMPFQFDRGMNGNTHTSNTQKDKPSEQKKKDADASHDEKALQDFFTSTGEEGEGEEEEEEYDSDGGTKYVKDGQSGKWIDARLMPPPKKQKVEEPNASEKNNDNKKLSTANTKKIKKAKFKAKNAKCWVYVTGLPTDTDENEVAKFFSKVGILDLDPETQKPKVKLYRYRRGEEALGKPNSLKGDGSICYARSESVELALQLLDDAPFRAISGRSIKDGNIYRLSVQRAKFEQHGKEYKDRRKVSEVKRKVARLAKLQAIGWDDGENGRITGGLKGLRIIVLKQAFDIGALRAAGPAKEDEFLTGVESKIRGKCEDFGTVEKITIFSKGRSDGVVIVKFTQPTAASKAIEEYNGKIEEGNTIEAFYWDGVTDYTVRNEELEARETEKRLDEFGTWLDDQELPEEFQLKVEGSS